MKCFSVLPAVTVVACLTFAAFADAQPSLSSDLIGTSNPLTAGQMSEVRLYITHYVDQLTLGSDSEVAAARVRLLEPLNMAGSDIFARTYSAELRLPLQPVMESSRTLVRINAMVLAASVRDPGVVGLIKTGLADSSSAVRYEACRALQQFLDQPSIDSPTELLAVQRSLLDAVKQVINSTDSQQLWRPIFDAMVAFTIPEARELLLQALDKRVAAHAAQPAMSLAPERMAMGRLFFHVVQQGQGDGSQNSRIDKPTVRMLALVAYRFLTLAATIVDQQVVAEPLLSEYREMGVAADGILRWSVKQMLGDAAQSQFPEPIERAVNQGLWADVLLQSQRWRPLLTQPPFNFTADQLAVPSVTTQ